MFENSLLIIKPDYMHKRKPLLLKLLQIGFFIQGQRRLAFTPEHAAEFYSEFAEDKCFMFQVILLSKGNCEALILAKENAVEELHNTMVCYFGTSIEMSLNVHVPSSPDHVRREINFIFPNYIHEPIPRFESHKFCSSSYMKPIINEMCDIAERGTDPCKQQNWRMHLGEWLNRNNKALPHVSNQCSTASAIHMEEKGQQTSLVALQKSLKNPLGAVCHEGSIGDVGSMRTSGDSSAIMSSTSCISCTCFDDAGVCIFQPEVSKEQLQADVDFFMAKTMEPPSSDSEFVHGAGIKWRESSDEGSQEAIEDDGAAEGEKAIGEQAAEAEEGVEEQEEHDVASGEEEQGE